MKKIYTIIFPLVSLLIVGSVALGQQVVRNNFYVQNPYLINPALTGFHGEFSGYLNYRDQWQGLYGAPEVAQIGAHGPISEHMGLGAKGSFQSLGIFRETILDVTWAYWMHVHDGASLSLGASMGFAYSSIDEEEVRISNPVDQALYNGNHNESVFNSGFGLHYDYHDFAANLAVPTIYNPIDQEYLALINFETSYDFFVANDVWRIHPSIYYQRSSPNLNQFDFTVMGEWDNILFGQLGYRTNNSIWIAAGATFQDVGVMYGYEINNSKLNTVSAGSHEIMIYIDIDNAGNARFKGHSYYKGHQKHRKFRKRK